MKYFSLITLASLGALVLATAPGALANTKCSSIVGPPTYSTTTFQAIDDNLDVDISICELKGGGTVTGNVTVKSGNSLELEGNWVITGNLVATNCAVVNLNVIGSIPVAYTTTIGGNVQIENCTGAIGNVWAFFTGTAGSVIMGNFDCQNNSAACYLTGATVGGNVTVSDNVYPQPIEPPPPVPPIPNTAIANNKILNNLKCQNNSPAPLVGLGTNIVMGNSGKNSEGQCLGF
jgi:hypothetical protein